MSVKLSALFPITERLRDYDRGLLGQDAVGGLTTAIMLVPQGMAYAMLAGVSPIMGLYTATVPLVIYALLGTSRQLAVGPVAMASLIVASAIAQLPDAATLTPAAYGAIAIAMTMLAGAIQILMGVARLGFLVNLLSHPVITGFTSAAALIIATSQLTHLLGVKLPRGRPVYETLWHAAQSVSQINWTTLLIGVGAIGLISGLKRWRPTFPAALTAVVVGILTAWLLDLEQTRQIAVLGTIPGGLPTPALPTGLSLDLLEQLLPAALAIALISFMESISAAKTYARQFRYDVHANQELIGLGAANITSGLFGGYAVGGALSRTAVHAQAGARTQVAGIITAAAIAITLLFLTPLFYHLPNAVLAAIIMVACAGLLDTKEIRHLWHVKRDDLALLLITFFATLFIGIELGIVVGVGASLLWLIFSTTRPHIATLGHLKGTRSYRSIDHFPDAETYPGVLILRMDAQFFFGNVSFLKDTLAEHLDEATDTEPYLAVVLDASSMNTLDSTAAEAFEEIIRDLREQREIELFISHVKGPVLEVMAAAGLVELLGTGHLFYEVDDAVHAALDHCDAVHAGAPPDHFGPSDPID